jgi:hypothetical protein
MAIARLEALDAIATELEASGGFVELGRAESFTRGHA